MKAKKIPTPVRIWRFRPEKDADPGPCMICEREPRGAIVEGKKKARGSFGVICKWPYGDDGFYCICCIRRLGRALGAQFVLGLRVVGNCPPKTKTRRTGQRR